ncbi:MAG: hypothetical protein WCK37_04210 [Candidatus Falkowbacteria bacterium]
MPKNINIFTKIKFQAVLWLFFYLLIFSICFNSTASYLDPDFGWHLKMGQEIINTGAVPHINTINYTLAGARWVDHEWLSEALMYKAYTVTGYQGIEIILSLLIVLILFLLNRFIKKQSETSIYSDYLIMALEIFALIAALPSFGIRLQEIGLLFFLLLILIIKNYEKNKNYKILWFLLPLLYLWSNLHGTFLIAFFVCGIFIGVKIVELILHKKIPEKYLDYTNILTGKQISIFFVFALAAGLTTLLTPYGGELYSFLFTYSNTYYMTVIAEWWPQWFFPYSYAQLLFISFTLSIICLNIYLALKKSKKIDLLDLALILIFSAMALKSRRHTQLLVIISLPIIFVFIKDFLDLNNLKPQVVEKKSLYKLGGKIFIIIILILISAGKLADSNSVKNPFQDFCGSYPCAAIKFIQDNPQYNSYKLYNNYAWGGFLIWTYPTRQLFIDGRMPQANYENYSLLEEYKSFYDKDAIKISSKINKHDIKLFMLDNSDNKMKLSWLEKYFFMIDENKVNEKKDELKDYLNTSAEWKIIYQDKLSVIYAKNN